MANLNEEEKERGFLKEMRKVRRFQRKDGKKNKGNIL